MTDFLVLLTLALALVSLVLLVVLLRRAPGATEQALESQLGSLRGESAGLESRLREELGRNRESSDRASKEQREELAKQMKSAMDSLDAGLSAMRNASDERFENLRATIDRKLKEIQEGNAAKLEEMRKTVDEKLQGTLEKRLGESFKQVSERLELVHKGLGEMQSLASGVGDLKRVLTNVKTRGTWGEVQLANLLEQVLTPEQYAANVATKPGSPERVEFAIKLPGRDPGEGQVWLPIDAKFPKEDYERLVDAAERANPEAVELAAKALEEQVRHEASEIQKKYVDPPHTTDFGILFLPTEGLYAEVLRRPGLAERLQRENRVMVAGPTTLAALLNSLQMGFRTLAIEKRSSEVWQVLGAVKTEFAKFGEVMDKVQKKLQEATNVIDTAKSRSNVIRRKLKDVEGLPSAQAIALLGTPEESAEESESTDTGGGEG
jgi:DNA recombination protein RmuC